MKPNDPIKPTHYRQGDMDLFDAWHATLPLDQYKAVMVCIAERYMKRDKDNPIQDLNKAIYTLERLKERLEEDEAKRAVKSWTS